MTSKFGGIPVEDDANTKSKFGGIPVDDDTSVPSTQTVPQSGGVVNDVANTYAGDISGAWNKLKSDYVATMPDKSFLDESFWDQLKSQFRGTVASGSLPVDAFNLVISPIAGAIHAGPVKAIASGEHALIGALPGGKDPRLTSEPQMENDLMGALSTVAPEKGVSLAGPAAAVPKAPQVADLKSAARQAYATVDNSGMKISPTAIKDLHSTIEKDLKTKGFHEKLQPRTQIAVDEIKNAAGAGAPHSLQDVDVLRRIVGHAAGSPDASDKFMARVVRDHIDDFIDNLGPQHLTGAKDQDALDALKTARDSWKRASKGEIIEGVIEKAKTNAHNYTTSGLENSLRVQFRKIANNSRAMSRFSPDEQAAIKKVATGGPLVNSLRMLGKFAPHGIVSTATGAGLGFAVGGAPGAIVLPIVGEAGRFGAKALTSKSAAEASELVRRGGPAPQVPSTPVLPRIYPVTAAANAMRRRSLLDPAENSYLSPRSVLDDGQ